MSNIVTRRQKIANHCKETSKVKEIPLYQDSKGGHSLLVGQQEDIKTNLQLSFIKETKHAKKYDVIKEYPNMRNEGLVKAVMGKKI